MVEKLVQLILIFKNAIVVVAKPTTTTVGYAIGGKNKINYKILREQLDLRHRKRTDCLYQVKNFGNLFTVFCQSDVMSRYLV